MILTTGGNARFVDCFALVNIVSDAMIIIDIGEFLLTIEIFLRKEFFF